MSDMHVIPSLELHGSKHSIVRMLDLELGANCKTASEPRDDEQRTPPCRAREADFFETHAHVTAIGRGSRLLRGSKNIRVIASIKGPNGATSYWPSTFTAHHHRYVDS